MNEFYKYIKYIPVIVALFPWVSFGLLNMDSQPWPGIVFGIFLLYFYKYIYISRAVLCVFSLMTCGFLLAIYNSADPFQFLTLKILYSYTSFLIIFVGFKYWIERSGFPLRLFIIINIIWIVMGLIEFAYPEIKEIFLYRRTSPERGMTSFAPEPTFFAMYLIFISWIMFASDYRPNNIFFNIYTANIITILFVSMSSMGLAYLLLAMAFCSLYMAVFHKKYRYYILIGVFLTICIGLIIQNLPMNVLESYRILEVVVLGFERGFSIFYYDKSMNARLESMVFSIQAAFLSGLIPAGVGSFQDYHPMLREWWGGFFWYSQPTSLIMSWIGDYLYTFGFFALSIFYFIFSSIGAGDLRRYFEMMFLFLVLLGAIPTSLPMVPMLIAVYAWKKNRSIQSIKAH